VVLVVKPEGRQPSVPMRMALKRLHELTPPGVETDSKPRMLSLDQLAAEPVRHPVPAAPRNLRNRSCARLTPPPRHAQFDYKIHLLVRPDGCLADDSMGSAWRGALGGAVRTSRIQPATSLRRLHRALPDAAPLGALSGAGRRVARRADGRAAPQSHQARHAGRGRLHRRLPAGCGSGAHRRPRTACDVSPSSTPRAP